MRFQPIFVPLVFIGLVFSASLVQANANLYVPLDPGTPSSGPAGVTIIAKTVENGTVLEPSVIRHDFRYYSNEMSGKLGISFVDLSGSKEHSFIVAESPRGKVYEAELAIEGDSAKYQVKALVGTACRVSMVVNGMNIKAAINPAGASLEFKMKTIEETMSFLAIGFTTYKPFRLTVNNDGFVDLVEVRKSLIDIFNSYNDAQADLSEMRPTVLGYYIPQELAKKLDGKKSITLTVNN